MKQEPIAGIFTRNNIFGKKLKMLKPTGIFGQKKLSSDPGDISSCCLPPAVIGLVISEGGNPEYRGYYYPIDPASLAGTDLDGITPAGSTIMYSNGVAVLWANSYVDPNYTWRLRLIADAGSGYTSAANTTGLAQDVAFSDAVGTASLEIPVVSPLYEGAGAGGCCAPYDADKKMHTGGVPGMFKPSEAYSS